MHEPIAVPVTPGLRSFDDPDEPLWYHRPERGGFVSFLTLDGRRKGRQTSVHLHELPETLRAIRARDEPNVYVSQNEFFARNRRAVNCARMTSSFLDLDTYRVPRLAGLPLASVLEQLEEELHRRNLPQPSLIVHSGRGLQPKWVLTEPIPRAAWPRWHAVQAGLLRALGDFGADSRAIDVSRVLRLVGSRSSRTNTRAEVVWQARVPTLGATRVGHRVLYDFESLAETVLPLGREQLAQLAAQRIAKCEAADAGKQAPRTLLRTGAKALSAQQLAWDRLEDLRRLASLRGWDDGAPPGNRNAFVFLAACFLAQTGFRQSLRTEVSELAMQFAPTWSAREVHDATDTALARVKAAERGETVVWDGKAVDPRYRFTNAWLLEFLSIEACEESQLQTIIGRDEARRRDRQRKARQRELAGMCSRQAYLDGADARRLAARRLKSEGLSLKRIAEQLGISKSSASRYCADL